MLPEFHNYDDDHQLDYAREPNHSNCVKPLECDFQIRLVPIDNARYGGEVNGQRARHRLPEPFLSQYSPFFYSSYAGDRESQKVGLQQDQPCERFAVSSEKEERRTAQEHNPNQTVFQ